jgi:hypothetical protein
MIKSIRVEKLKTVPELRKSILYIEFADGTFVAHEIDHLMSKSKLSDSMLDFARFINNESKKEAK